MAGAVGYEYSCSLLPKRKWHHRGKAPLMKKEMEGVDGREGWMDGGSRDEEEQSEQQGSMPPPPPPSPEHPKRERGDPVRA